MTTDDIIYDIIKLPRRFNEWRDKSVHTLLVETGYIGNRSQITVDAIRDSLSKHPEFAIDWLQYSEDKRTATGWYFKAGCSEEYIVGCLVDGNRRNADPQFFDNRVDACAVFIKWEIDSILWP